jgi:hypothetical protein
MQRVARIGLTLLVWGALLGWGLTADRLECTVAAVPIALAAGLIALSGMEVAFYRRHAFLRHFLVPEGLLFRVLGRRVLILVRQGIKSLLLAFILLIGVLGMDWPQWLLLLVDVFMLTALLAVFSSLFSGEVREAYRLPMARHWAGRINALLLWLAWALLIYYSPQENYAGLSWEQVVAYSAHESRVGCDALAVLANLGVTGEALALWFAQNQFSGLKDPDHLLTVWVAFVATVGASFLLVWAYTRALVGALARPWCVWREADGEDSN